MTDWYFQKDGKKCGPFNTTSLKKLARTGNLQPSDMIWRKGLSKWVPASKAKGLFDSGNIETNTDYDCPSASRIARNELSKSKATGISSEAKIIIALVSVVTLVIGPFLLWVFVFRDTWENDNWDKIAKMSDSVQQLIWNNKLEEGVAKYDELLAFIGDRELKQDALRRNLQEAKEIAEPVRRKVNEAKNLERLRSLEERAKAFAESGEIRRAVEAYREALDLIRKADSENPEFAQAIRRITAAKNRANLQLVKVERARKEMEAREKELEAMASVNATLSGSAWITKGSGQSNILRGLSVYLIKKRLPDEAVAPIYEKVQEIMNKNISSISWSLNNWGEYPRMARVIRNNLESATTVQNIIESDSEKRGDIAWLFKAIRITQLANQNSSSIEVNYYGKDTIWPVIISMSLIQTTETDVGGKYRLGAIPWGEYYIYAIYESNFSIAEWLLEFVVDKSGEFRLDLKNSNAEFIVNKN